MQVSTWHLMALMPPRNKITAFSANRFVSVFSLQFSETRFLNLIVAGSVSLFNVISLYPNELMNLVTL